MSLLSSLWNKIFGEKPKSPASPTVKASRPTDPQKMAMIASRAAKRLEEIRRKKAAANPPAGTTEGGPAASATSSSSTASSGFQAAPVKSDAGEQSDNNGHQIPHRGFFIPPEHSQFEAQRKKEARQREEDEEREKKLREQEEERQRILHNIEKDIQDRIARLAHDEHLRTAWTIILNEVKQKKSTFHRSILDFFAIGQENKPDNVIQLSSQIKRANELYQIMQKSRERDRDIERGRGFDMER